MHSLQELHSVIDLIKQIFSSTAKCVGKYCSEWVNKSTEHMLKVTHLILLFLYYHVDNIMILVILIN